jgi:hypothetical protein
VEYSLTNSTCHFYFTLHLTAPPQPGATLFLV